MTMMFLSCNVIVIVYIFTAKGYIRKGHALLAMKDISKSRQAFQTAVDLDPNSAVSLHSDCLMIAHLLILFDHIPCTRMCSALFHLHLSSWALFHLRCGAYSMYTLSC